MILWYWYSWHRRGSFDQDEDVGQLTAWGNIRLNLKKKTCYYGFMNSLVYFRKSRVVLLSWEKGLNLDHQPILY